MMKELPDRLQGWITPNGRYIESKNLMPHTLYHWELADAICRKKGYECKFYEKESYNQSPEDRLYELGFMKIQNDEIMIMAGFNKQVSDGQVKLFHRILDKFGKLNFYPEDFRYSKQDLTRFLHETGVERVKEIRINGRLNHD